MVTAAISVINTLSTDQHIHIHLTTQLFAHQSIIDFHQDFNYIHSFNFIHLLPSNI